MTLTEALQETKTLKERIKKKRERLIDHIGRLGIIRDPLEDEGGQKEHCRREQQAIRDLETRLLLVRASISEANAKTVVTVADETKTIMDWLNWRRDIIGPRKNFIQQLLSHYAGYRKKIEEERTKLEAQAPERDHSEYKLITNLDESALRTELEWIEEVEGALDARLSVTNATTLVELGKTE